MRSTKKAKSFTPEPVPEVARVSSTSELARRLNLSRWTVSRVLNGHGGVHPETVRLVKEALHEYGFAASPLARGLRLGRTSIVGVCVPDIEYFYLDRKLSFLQQALEAEGYHPLISMTGGTVADEAAAIGRFGALRAAGVVTFASQLAAGHAVVRRFESLGTPLVRVDPRGTHPAHATLRVDRAAAMREAVAHLWKLGHRRFLAAGLSGGEPGSYSAHRFTAVRASLRGRKGASLKTYEFPEETRPFYEAGQATAEHLLSLPRPWPTAILALNDRVATGLIHHLGLKGVCVPGDCSVIGWDNMESGAFLSPSLTSVETHPGLLIRHTAAHLLHQIRHPGEPGPEPKPICPQLVVRESTGPAPEARHYTSPSISIVENKH